MIQHVTLCNATLGENGVIEPPLGPLYIASALEKCGVEVDFRDYQLVPGASCFSGQSLADAMAGHAAVVAISCFVDMLPTVVDATRRLKELRPDTTIILGGPGPSASATRLVELYPWIDGVVRGEGEETIQEWVDRRNGKTRPLGPIAGMVVRQDGDVVVGPDRARNLEIDLIPRPAYHLVDWSAYSQGRVITTRGCAYRCSFCDVTALWGNRSVYREIDDVIDEMERLQEACGINAVGIVDDTFVQDRKRVRLFCNRLIERRSGIKWNCFSRINLMSPDLVELMAKAGCNSVFYGIDSGSPAVLARTHKMVRSEDVEPVVRYSSEAFDRVEASFIWGYPFESLDDFRMTLDLAAAVSRYAPRVNVQLHMLSPLPNSPIYREHTGPLLEPEAEDRLWLLLPSVFLDERAEELRTLVRSAPDVYPGFYAFPTPDKVAKRRLLEQVVQSSNRTIGSTILDPRMAQLLQREAPEIEREVLERPQESSDRIGVGLALGVFRRSRRRSGVTTTQPSERNRGAPLVRMRNDTYVKF
jgi:radical SAM superfamily enzyme YgiQ (UPF0313 family)